MIGRMGCPDAIKRLVERFDHQLDQVRSPSYNEAQLRIDFIKCDVPRARLGHRHFKGSAEQYPEVVYEDSIPVKRDGTAPSAAIGRATRHGHTA